MKNFRLLNHTIMGIVFVVICNLTLSWLDYDIVEAKCWYEKWGIKVCDWETPTEDIKREVSNGVQWIIDRVPGAAACPYLIEGSFAYVAYLENQAKGKWKRLPNKLQQAIGATTYGSVSLPMIEYAEEVNIPSVLGSGTAMTIGNKVFFPSKLDLENDINDLYLLLHEIEHSQQYAVLGGIAPFLVKYMCLDTCVRIHQENERTVWDVHDCKQIEQDADNKRDRIYQDVWCEWQVALGKPSGPCQGRNPPQVSIKPHPNAYEQAYIWAEARYNFHVDADYRGVEHGTETEPYNTLTEAYASAWDGALIIAKAGNYAENFQFDKPFTLVADGGTVTLTKRGFGLFTPPPVVVGRDALAFAAVEAGVDPSDQFLTIAHTGESSRTWSAQVNQPWLTLSKNAGTTPFSLRLSINNAGLTAGTHVATITVRDTEKPELPQNIDVTVTIRSPSGVPDGGLAVVPNEIPFITEPDSSTQLSSFFIVTNEGFGQTTWGATTTQSWLQVEPLSGITPSAVSLQIDRGALETGRHTAQVNVSGSKGTQVIKVTVQIGTTQQVFLPFVTR